MIRVPYASCFQFIFANLFSLVLDHIFTLKIAFAPFSNGDYGCLLW